MAFLVPAELDCPADSMGAPASIGWSRATRGSQATRVGCCERLVQNTTCDETCAHNECSVAGMNFSIPSPSRFECCVPDPAAQLQAEQHGISSIYYYQAVVAFAITALM